jgi:hypothetical protein
MARLELPLHCKSSDAQAPCAPPFLAYMEVTGQSSMQQKWSRILHISGYVEHLDIILEDETLPQAHILTQVPAPKDTVSPNSQVFTADLMHQNKPPAMPPVEHPIPFGSAVQDGQGRDRYSISPATLTALTSCLEHSIPCSRTELLTSQHVPYYFHFTAMEKQMCTSGPVTAERQPSAKARLPRTQQKETPTYSMMSMWSTALVICAFLSGGTCALALSALSSTSKSSTPLVPPKVDVACWQTPRLELGKEVELSAMATQAGWQTEVTHQDHYPKRSQFHPALSPDCQALPNLPERCSLDVLQILILCMRRHFAQNANRCACHIGKEFVDGSTPMLTPVVCARRQHMLLRSGWAVPWVMSTSQKAYQPGSKQLGRGGSERAYGWRSAGMWKNKHQGNTGFARQTRRM